MQGFDTNPRLKEILGFKSKILDLLASFCFNRVEKMALAKRNRLFYAKNNSPSPSTINLIAYFVDLIA
jgi:hypothetical protein